MNQDENNNYNIHNAMDDNAFDIFNQKAQQQPVVPSPVNNTAQTTTPQHPVPIATPTPTQNENLVTVNDYKPPKEPFSFKKLLKKKIEKEEKTFSIDDITNFKDDGKKVDMEEVKEKRKKVKDIVILIGAIIGLVVAVIMFINIFSNYTMGENIVNNNSVLKIKSSKEIVEKEETKEVTSYMCDKTLDVSFYKIPNDIYINWEAYKGNITYTFNNDKLATIKEEYTLLYNDMNKDENRIIINYCNNYNKVLDQYQLLCTYSSNYLSITNNINLTKLDNESINNSLVIINPIYNTNTILGDILSTNNNCSIVK